MSKIRLRAVRELKKVLRRPFANQLNPFQGEHHPAIVHCCYHKIGTVWFLRVLGEVAAHFGMTFVSGSDFPRISQFEAEQNADIFIDQGSHLQLDQLSNYIGSHMIRDPRDMVVSAYFYHLWTPEPWANLPLAEHRGMSYKEYLNSLDKTEGLLTEIRRSGFWVTHMASWDFANPLFYEIRYEDIRVDEENVFRGMFNHYGFTDKAVEASCRIANKYTFARLGKKPGSSGVSHLRSGKVGEWRDNFEQVHTDLFKELYPEAVVRLGYEKDDNW